MLCNPGVVVRIPWLKIVGHSPVGVDQNSAGIEISHILSVSVPLTSTYILNIYVMYTKHIRYVY